MFGLIGCNAFYASCEVAFQPALEGRPVVVLSNNDGNIISRNNPAKRLGLSIGMPFFKASDIIDRHGVTWFSSNYPLYGDMSRRVMDTISRFVPEQENYSIDEAFVNFDGSDTERIAHEIRMTVRRWTGIPVSVGCGSTKVLAKVANHIAKRNPEYDGVVVLAGDDVDRYLRDFDVSDVWGIGPQYARFLKSDDEDYGQRDLWEASGLGRVRQKPKVETALELKRCSDRWIRRHLTIKGLRLVWELRGISCLPLEIFEKPRKGLCCSRSFGRAVTTLEELKEAVATHATRGSEKLRRQRLAAQHLTVFISTSHFRQSPEEVYSASASWRLMLPTSYPPALVSAALPLLECVYKPGFVYQKAGVFLTDIVPAAEKQQSFIERVDEDKQARVMSAVDGINKKYGRYTVRPLAVGFDHKWRMKQQRLSSRYTTRLDEVLRVRG